MWRLKKLRVWFKDLLCFLRFGSYLVEYCGACGVKQPLVWWCEDNALWAHIDPRNETLCPNCFDRRARQRDIFLRWYPRDESGRANGVPPLELDGSGVPLAMVNDYGRK